MSKRLKSHKPIIVEFPLRGEWLSTNTPGTKIPSHGTNKLGTRYAYDFLQVDWKRKGLPAYRVSLPQYLLFGVPLNEYYCWGQEVYAPCDGIVVQAKDGYKERERTNLLADISYAYKIAHYFNPKKNDIQSVAGNYIIMKCGDQVYAALVHLQTESIQVSVGQSVKKAKLLVEWVIQEILICHICIFSLWIAVTCLLQTDCLVLLNNMKSSKMVSGKKSLTVFPQIKIG